MDADVIALLAVILGIPIGIPVISRAVVDIVKIARDWRIRARELSLLEKQAEMTGKLQIDEFNAKVIRMDDLGMSPSEMTSLTSEVRQLRQELAQLRQEVNNRNA